MITIQKAVIQDADKLTEIMKKTFDEEGSLRLVVFAFLTPALERTVNRYISKGVTCKEPRFTTAI